MPYVRSLFCRVEDISAACLLLAYPLALLGTSWLYPVWERYGVRFQVLCISVLVSMAFIICSRNALERFSAWFWRSPLIFLVPLWLFWLGVMGFRHGILAESSHRQGLLSGLLVSMAIPIVSYLSLSIRSKWILRLVPLSLMVVVLFESFCLAMYSYFGVSYNDSFVFFGVELPRVFLNTRDGAAWAVALAATSFYFLCFAQEAPARLMNRCSYVVHLVSLSACYFLALLTSSRGIFASIIVGFMVSALAVRKNYARWRFFLVLNGIALVVARTLMLLIEVNLSHSSPSVVTRFVGGDSTRLRMIHSWFTSIWVDPSSWVLGKGFNHFPVNYLPSDIGVSNVHNLYVQLLVDAGLLGIVVACITLGTFATSARKRLRGKRDDISVFVAFSLSSFLIYSATAALLFWPSGMWLSFLLLLMVCKIIGSRVPVNAGYPEIGVEGISLVRALPAFLFFISFLVVQVPLVAHNYTSLASMFFKVD